MTQKIHKLNGAPRLVETAPETESKEMNQPEPEKVTESHTEPQSMAQDKFTRLVRVDKNGTKIYEDWRCSRCGGAGGADKWAFTGWTCYECGGTGVRNKPLIYKEYTPEHEAKLKAQREKRQAKLQAQRDAEERAKAQELNARFFSKNGFDADGNIWVILGDTYSIKDELKELGCKFDYSLGWHCDHELAGHPQLKLTASQICNQNENGVFVSWRNQELSQLISEAQEAIKGKEPESNYVGAVGDRIDITATFKREISYTVQIDWMTQTKWIYIFVDDSGNQLTWNTTAILTIEQGSRVNLRGTIKAHKEYKGIKQTELQRCKITKEVM